MLSLPNELSSPPDGVTFLREYVLPNKPVIINGLTENWKTIKLWNLDYFQESYTNATGHAGSKGGCAESGEPEIAR